jgi:hypothetical protein
MNKLRPRFTLPELQERLDGLSEGALFQISRRDYERLFGTSDVATTLLRNFATSHACVVVHANAAILFRKQIMQREDTAGSSAGS